MEILATLKTDLKTAMKEGNSTKLSVIRMLIAEIQSGLTASKPVAEVQSILKYKKKLEDALQLVVDKSALENEISIVDLYCPKRPSREEIVAFVTTLDKAEAFGIKMKKVKEAFPLAEGQMVSEVVKELT